MITNVTKTDLLKSTAHVTLLIADLIKTAATYDLAVADGDVLIESIAIYSKEAAAELSYVAIHTDNAVPFEVMTAAEGTVDSLTDDTNIITANNNVPFLLTNGKKLQYTIDSAGGAGKLHLAIKWRMIGNGTLNVV